MKGADYLALARLLMANGDLARGEREAKARTAISRAYYAVYLEVRNRLFPAEINVKHGHIIQQVMREVGLEQAAHLRNLYRMRERADYRLAEAISDEDAKECIRIGEELIAAIS